MIKEMYQGVAFSPLTFITEPITVDQLTIPIESSVGLVDGDNYATLEYENRVETIKYTGIENGNLVGVTRAVEGIPYAFPTGSHVYRSFSNIDYQTILDNISTLSDMISDITDFTIEKVDELPETGKNGVFYLVAKEDGSYYEYIWVGDSYELIGSLDIDLSGYATISELENFYNKADVDSKIVTISTALSDKVDVVSGKGLSTNDYTNNDKTKVEEINNKVDIVSGKGLSTNDYTDSDKAKVEEIDNKVDKVEGKGLSTNDYTNSDKELLATLSGDIEAYVLPNATAETLGGVTIGSNVMVSNGKISVPEATGSTFGVIKSGANTSLIGGVLDVNIGYDLIIRTQSEFEAMYESSDWLGAKSVLFVGDGGNLKFKRSGQGLLWIESVKNIKGINNAIIEITDFEYNATNNKAGLWCADVYDDCYMDGLNVECTATATGTGTTYGGYTLTNCTNFTLTATATGTTYGGYTLTNCTNFTATATATGTGNAYGGYTLTNCTNFTLTATATGNTYGGHTLTNCTNFTATGTATGTGNVYGGHTLYQVADFKAIGTSESASGYAIYNAKFVSNASRNGSASTTSFLGGTNLYVDSETVVDV